MLCMMHTLLKLEKAPVAVAFLAAPPEGVEKYAGEAVPAGCTFWKLAMERKTFYTVPSDHYNCAVGSHTHNIALPAGRAAELEDTIGFMVQSNYLAMAEVPGIPVLASSPAVIAYGPADSVSFTPDVVIVAVKPAQAMFLYEAALKAGAGNALTNTLGRPGCAILPLALGQQTTALSFGCAGNRVFTGIGEEDMYVAIPGAKYAAVMDKLQEVMTANCTMEEHYRSKLVAQA
jgi:uncharacterized protein (DUF169 family)